MYFEISLIPKELIIEAENEEDLKSITKRITIEKLVWKTVRMNKDDVKKELKSRNVYLKL